jgi:proprotein convertase subtilisin/kexin type 5
MNCTSCITTLNLYLTSSFTCVNSSSCPLKTYPNPSNFQCSDCVLPCITCLNFTACLSCTTGYNYQSSDNSCVNTCLSGFAAISGICKACTSPCTSCSGLTTSCVTCDPSITPSVYLYQNYCTKDCPETFYADISSQKCMTCSSPCLNCKNITYCLSCVATFNLY